MIDNRTPEQKQEDYREARWAWNADPENGLIPYRKTRKGRAVKPPPGELDADAAEEG